MTQQPRMRKRFLDCSGMSMEMAESYAKGLCEQQRDVMFQLGDLYRYCESKWPDKHVQVWPEWVSPGNVQRAAGVCRYYPKEEDRQHEATYTQYKQVASDPERMALLEWMVNEGLTSDESRERLAEHRRQLKQKEEKKAAPTSEKRRLIAVDVNYEVTRRFDTMGLEAGGEAAAWIERLVERLKADWNFTDAVCCFDSPNSFRRELTSHWEEGDRYKEGRSKKDPEHIRQLEICEELLHGKGFCCVKIDGYEADDIMASYGSQFDGKVVLASPDKDMRQCLSDNCSMLPKIEWIEDPESGEMRHEYHWITAKKHFKDGVTYSGYEVKGVPASEWVELQTLAGDGTDNVSGAVGIGPKHALDLLSEFGSIEAAIAAAKEDHPSITPSKRKSLIEFEGKLPVTRQLVTLVDTLELPTNTKI